MIFKSEKHEYAFALWCNSTLGLLLHWWTSNKTQSGRGRSSVTGIPNIPTLDTHALGADYNFPRRARRSSVCGNCAVLPFDQIDE